MQLGYKLNKGFCSTFQRLEIFFTIPISKLSAFIRRTRLIRIFLFGFYVKDKAAALKRYDTVKQ